MHTERRRGAQLRAFQEKIGYIFSAPELFEEALTHSSYANENGGKYNERLEYLGDAVLELATSKYLYLKHPECSEGGLTFMRAGIVCKDSLAAWARANGLTELIRVGKSLKTGPTGSMAADCAEAVFGAVFLDGGYQAAEKVAARFLSDMEVIGHAEASKSPKTKLQEYCQSHGMGMPVYEIVERTGPEHAPSFRVSVAFSGGRTTAEGCGASMKAAEACAAEAALEKLVKNSQHT